MVVVMKAVVPNIMLVMVSGVRGLVEGGIRDEGVVERVRMRVEEALGGRIVNFVV
jgi:hypothetical protein